MDVKTIDYRAIGLEIHAISGVEEVIVKCPYHDDLHPSASFNIVKGLFFCFACGASANAEQLAKKLGGHVIRNDYVPKVTMKSAEMDWQSLLASPLAWDNEYLQSRGVTEEQIGTFSILDLIWGIGFPIKTSSDTKALLIRRYDGNPRYLFFGNKPKLLVGRIRKSYSCTIVEGIFGLLAADRAEVNAGCTFGTSISPDLRGLTRNLSNVQCLFDADFPGYLAAGKFLYSVPLGYAIVPGQEADELTVEEWKAIDRGEVMRTNDIAVVRRLAKDTGRFTKLMNSYKRKVK